MCEDILFSVCWMAQIPSSIPHLPPVLDQCDLVSGQDNRGQDSTVLTHLVLTMVLMKDILVKYSSDTDYLPVFVEISSCKE